MATRDLYINLKANSLTGAFIVSHKSAAPYVMPAFMRQEKVALRIFFVTPNATGGFSDPFTIEDVSAYTVRVAIGTSHTPLAGPGSFIWDSGNLCWTGTLDLYTSQLETALGSAGATGLAGQTFEVELSKSGQLFRAQQTVTVKQCVLDDMAGDPANVDPGVFASQVALALQDINLGVYRLTASTTDATPTELLRVDNGARMTLVNGSARGFSILIQGVQVSGGAVVASQLYRIEGIGTRGTGAATVAIGSGEQLRLDPIGTQPFGVPAVDADTTNGAVRFKVTGLAATNITWNATLIWA